MLHLAPGATLLAVTSFTTATGLFGRVHVASEPYRKVPFQSNLWYAGVGDAVVKIVLTLLAGPHPDFLATGTAAAWSVRSVDPTGARGARGTTGSSLGWMHTARPGPFMIDDATESDRVRLSSVTGSVRSDYLVKLAQWVQEHGSD